MPGISDSLRNDIWNRVLRTGATSIRPSAIYVALFTTLPDDTGAGGVEPGNGYARQQVVQLDANWTAPVGGVCDNVNAIVFGPASGAGGFGRVLGVGLYDAVTGGTYLGSFPFVESGASLLNFFAQSAFNDLVSLGHGYVINDRLFLIGDSLPAPLVVGTEYYVAFASASSFTVSLTESGPDIDVTEDKGGTMFKSGAVVVPDLGTLTLNAGDLDMVFAG